MARFRYSYDALVYFGEDISDSIERVARLGYDAIELVGEPQQLDSAKIKRLTADAGYRRQQHLLDLHRRARPRPPRRERPRARPPIRQGRRRFRRRGGVSDDHRRAHRMHEAQAARRSRRRAQLGDRGPPCRRRVRRRARRKPRAGVLEPLRDLLVEPPRPGRRALERGRSRPRRGHGRHVPHEHRGGLDRRSDPPHAARCSTTSTSPTPTAPRRAKGTRTSARSSRR